MYYRHDIDIQKSSSLTACTEKSKKFMPQRRGLRPKYEKCKLGIM